MKQLLNSLRAYTSGLKLLLILLILIPLLTGCGMLDDEKKTQITLSFYSPQQNHYSQSLSNNDQFQLHLVASRPNSSFIIPLFSGKVSHEYPFVTIEVPLGDLRFQGLIIEEKSEVIRQELNQKSYINNKIYKLVTQPLAITTDTKTLQLSFTCLSDFVSGKVAGRWIQGINASNNLPEGPTGPIVYELSLDPSLPPFPINKIVQDKPFIFDGWFNISSVSSSDVQGIRYRVGPPENPQYLFNGAFLKAEHFANLAENSPIGNSVHLWLPYRVIHRMELPNSAQMVRIAQPASYIVGFWHPGLNLNSVEVKFWPLPPSSTYNAIDGWALSRLAYTEESGENFLDDPSYQFSSYVQIGNADIQLSSFSVDTNNFSNFRAQLYVLDKDNNRVTGGDKILYEGNNASYYLPAFSGPSEHKIQLLSKFLNTPDFDQLFVGFNGPFKFIETAGSIYQGQVCLGDNASAPCLSKHYLNLSPISLNMVMKIGSLAKLFIISSEHLDQYFENSCSELEQKSNSYANIKALQVTALVSGDNIKFCRDTECNSEFLTPGNTLLNSSNLPNHHLMLCIQYHGFPVIRPIVLQGGRLYNLGLE